MAKANPRAGESTTANYGWMKPTVGASDDAWGGYINADLDGIDTTVKSVSTVANAAYPASNPSGYQTAAQLPVASSTTPVMNGVAAIGVGTTWARADHVHPSDTSRLALSGGVMTGALTPLSTAGLVGTITNDNANAGAIGEVISSNVTSPVTLTTTGTAYNVANIQLTSGDWNISGEVWHATGTSPTGVHAGINSVSATLPAASAIGVARTSFQGTLTASATQVLSLRTCRVSVAGTTTYYLVARADFSAGSFTATGNIIARRAR